MSPTIPCLVTLYSKPRVGRPAVRQGRLGRWLLEHDEKRERIAQRLGIDRRYLDHLAREDRRPSLALALRIEALTDGAVPASYFASVRPRGAW